MEYNALPEAYPAWVYRGLRRGDFVIQRFSSVHSPSLQGHRRFPPSRGLSDVGEVGCSAVPVGDAEVNVKAVICFLLGRKRP